MGLALLPAEKACWIGVADGILGVCVLDQGPVVQVRVVARVAVVAVVAEDGELVRGGDEQHGDKPTRHFEK